MNGLMMHTEGSGIVTREQAFDKCLIPESTKTYQSVSNEEFILMLEDCARKHGLILTNETLGLASKGLRLFGTYEVTNKDFFNDRVKLMMGVCNSGDKSMRAKICFGAKVLICDNLCFHHWTDENGLGGFAAHKHMINVMGGLWQRMDQALSQVDTFRSLQDDFYSQLVDRKISDNEANDFIFRAGRTGVIGKSIAWRVADEWDNQLKYPETEEQFNREWHSEYRDRNAFNLLNAFTQAEKERKERNPVASNIESLGLSNFFYNEFISNN